MGLKTLSERYLPAVLLLLTSIHGFGQSYYNNKGDIVLKLNANQAEINKNTISITKSGKGKGLVYWATPKNTLSDSKENAVPDLVFKFKLPEKGTYYIRTYAQPAVASAPGSAIETAYVKIQIDQQRPTSRIVFDRYAGSAQVAGKFELNNTEQLIKLWLPKGIQLAHIEFKQFIPPTVPEAAQHYVPKVRPEQGHPRLWVNTGFLPTLKRRITAPENQAAWEKVKRIAGNKFKFDFKPDQEIFHREEVEKAAETKAFYYLITGDKQVGNEAVQLLSDYLSVLEFGNVTYGDITREVGRSIYTAALVYDWCYDLLDQSAKKKLYDQMIRLAREMEIGWPPFDESILNGHGNEAQVSRDLLAMSIAIYDEDPEPYKYTSYCVLEQLVPMRKFEYQSPRHNQGVDYGAYRFGWEMHAVWLLHRMSGQTSFDDNIKNLPDYWLYMRLPDGYMLRDGDMFSVKNKETAPLYWKQPQTMLLSYAYANNGLIKAEFERQGGLPDNPVLFLLLNDPDLKTDKDLSKLPQTKDFGPVLGSMIARTGWNNRPDSDDVIAEIKGGGYNFGNHQHADAGALQIYYRGMQVGDLGLYLSYGTPYDLNFDKRSISHSTMLVYDPNEPLLFRTKVRDGGSRFSQRFPLSPEETQTDPWYNYGSVQSSSFGPSALKPSYSYFKADLAPAYTRKVQSFTREFAFFNLNRTDVPAVIVLADDITSNDPSFLKYWQINTLTKPDTTGAALVLHSTQNGKTGKTFVDMLVPSKQERKMQVLSGAKANSVFGVDYEVNSNKPEANGNRIMISPLKSQQNDKFLTVFQTVADGAQPVPVNFTKTGKLYHLVFADRVVAMSNSSESIRESFKINVPAGKEYQVLLTGLQPGFWYVKAAQNAFSQNIYVRSGDNTLYFKSTGGEYEITPGKSAVPAEVTPPSRSF